MYTVLGIHVTLRIHIAQGENVILYIYLDNEILNRIESNYRHLRCAVFFLTSNH